MDVPWDKEGKALDEKESRGFWLLMMRKVSKFRIPTEILCGNCEHSIHPKHWELLKNRGTKQSHFKALCPKCNNINFTSSLDREIWGNPKDSLARVLS